MRTRPEAWHLIPDFSQRLAEAMAYGGLSPEQLAQRLNHLGVETGPSYLRQILRSGTRRRNQGAEDEESASKPNPTLLLVAACAEALDVPTAWFFEPAAQTPAELLKRYGVAAGAKRSEIPDKPGQQRTQAEYQHQSGEDRDAPAGTENSRQAGREDESDGQHTVQG